MTKPAPSVSESQAQCLMLAQAAERAGEHGPLTAVDLRRAERSRPGSVPRAEALCERLFQRDPGLPRWLALLRWPGWVTPAVVAVAALAGLASDAIGPAGRVNLLAAPLLGVLAWNLAVTLTSVFALMRQARRGAWFARWVERAMRWRAQAAPAALPGSPAEHWKTRFIAEWLRASAPLTRARAGALLHAAAAVLAGSMLLGLYLRGLAFEYRAGWESTFLDANSVHALLGLVLGPASLISGIALPDAGRLALLRFGPGQGENAGPWIHLLAITIAMFAVLPRALLAASAHRMVRRLRQNFPLPDAYLTEQAEASPDGRGRRLIVVPCGWRPSPSASQALGEALRDAFGAAAQVDLAAATFPEQADEPDGLPVLTGASQVIVVFTLSATPEPETHGRLLSALQHRAPQGASLEPWIDETAFSMRFAGQPQRLAERRAAWRDLMSVHALTARFVRLGAPA